MEGPVPYCPRIKTGKVAEMDVLEKGETMKIQVNGKQLDVGAALTTHENEKLI